MLAEISIEGLLRTLGEKETGRLLHEIAHDRGQQVVRSIQAALGQESWSPEAFRDHFVLGSLREMGMEVDVLDSDDAHVHFRMRPCPFQELAETHTDLICNHLDRGFHEGMIEGMEGAVDVERFACMGHGDPHCEYAFRWKEQAKAAKLGP
jgi:predicted ArsR family transcriptional regulator